MANTSESDDDALIHAKLAFIDAAKAIDPLAPMRRRPFVSVGVAAGIGAMLGVSRERLLPPGSMRRVMSMFVRPIAFAVGRYVVARANDSTNGTTNKEPARTSTPF